MKRILLFFYSLILVSQGSFAQPTGRLQTVKDNIADFTRRISTEPTSFNYWRRASYYEETDPIKAIEDYNKAISLYVQGQSVSLSFLLSSLSKNYVITGNIDSAMECLNKAETYEKTHIENKYSGDNLNYYSFVKGELYSFLGNYDQSFPLMEACTRETVHMDGLYKLATAAMLTKNYAKAAELFKTALLDYKKQDPPDESSTRSRVARDFSNYIIANNAILAGNYNEAIEAIKGNFPRTFTMLDPLKFKTLTSYVIIADLYERLGQTDQALCYYKKVKTISPAHAYAIQKIAALEKDLADKSKADASPPVITLFSPAAISRGQNIRADKNKAMLIKGRAEDASGISWIKINGKTLEGAKVNEGFFEIQTAPAAVIEIQASDNAGNTSKIYSYEVALSEPSPQPSAFGDENYYALFIACSNYDGKWPPLNSTLGEARNLREALTSKYNFKADTLFNSSRMAITETIAKFISEHDKPTNNLLIFFAGHGTMQKMDNEPVGYLIPLYAQKTEDYIARKDIAILLDRSSAKHILFITDACLSEFMRGDADAQAMEVLNSTDYSLPSRQLLTSSGTKRAASKSVLVPAIISFLQKNNKPYVSVTDLYGNVLKEMISLRDTNPELALPTIGPMRIEGDKLGAFYFKKN